MTDIEKKALALLNEVMRERHGVLWVRADPDRRSDSHEALCRAIEQHEAFRQEVSDALSVYQKADGVEERSRIWDALTRFIIAQPDPLVEVLDECGFGVSSNAADDIRAAIEKRGGKIVWGEG